MALDPIPRDADEGTRRAMYLKQLENLTMMLAEEPDWIAAMASVACELHHAFAYFDWTGFYRVVAPAELCVGPYQGGHGCLRIGFQRGVCGAAARTRQTQLVADVADFPGHIACATTTRSEIVVPVLTPDGALLGVLDVDSDDLAAFGVADREGLEAICQWLGGRYYDAA